MTAEPVELMRDYESFRADIEDAVGEAYKRDFGESILVQFYMMITRKRGKKEL